MFSRTTYLALADHARDGALFPDSFYHGEDHWRAVAAQGLLIAGICNLGQTGRAMAALFGVLHDCRRMNDDYDPEHGARAAELLDTTPLLADLDSGFRDRLSHSLDLHDKGKTTADPLVGLGWDADRTLLTRCGINPDIAFFSCIVPDDLRTMITCGVVATEDPPSWEEIWHAAFAA